MTRAVRIALAALALAAAPGARAQWRAEPMPVRLGPSAAEVLAGSFAGAGAGAGLLVIDRASPAAEVRPFHDLLAPAPVAFPFTAQPTASPWRGGRLAQNGADGVADVARMGGASALEVAFGNAPGTLRTYPLLQPPQDPPAFVHLLARPAGDVLVVPYYPQDWFAGKLLLVDFDAAGASTVAQVLVAPLYVTEMTGQPFDAFPIRLSSVARASLVDDVALPGWGGVLLFLHRGPAPADVAAARGELEIVEVGGRANDYPLPARPPWLPSTVERGPALGVAALDVDLDGDLDLVFPQASPRPDSTAQGDLVWVEWKGAANPTAVELAAFGDYTASPWHDLGATLGLPDPVVVRQVDVGGVPAAAVWDRDLQEVVVLWPDYAAGRLASWRAPAPGVVVTDIRQVDVVGTAVPDLVVVVDNTWGTSPPPDLVLVYPDVTGPVLSWAPGSPGTPARGTPHTMEVAVQDPDASTSPVVEWVLGAPTSAPAGFGTSYTATLDCAAAGTISVTVRATDELGVFTEIRATLPIASLQPAISIAGASPPGRLVLPPGGTTVVLDGVAATGCGEASWGGEWPPEAAVSDASGPTWLRRTVSLPEAAYPALLADPAPAVSIATSDPGVLQPVVTLPLQLDGSGLVEVLQASDRPALAEGEVAVIRTRVRSRVAVPLPGVRVVQALSGLAPAGVPSVSGAVAVALARDGAEVVLDALPAAPGEVVIELPVRSAGPRGVASAEARSGGGWLLTPPAGARGDGAELPGCGCGSGGSGAGLALLALALAARGRRRPPRAT